MHSLVRSSRGLLKLKLRAHLFGRTPPYQNTLLATARPAEDLHGARRHAAGARKEPAQFLVRRTIRRRCRHPNFDRTAVKPCALSSRGFRLDVNGNDGALGCGANDLLCCRGPGLPPEIVVGHNIVGSARTLRREYERLENRFHDLDDAA